MAKRIVINYGSSLVVGVRFIELFAHLSFPRRRESSVLNVFLDYPNESGNDRQGSGFIKPAGRINPTPTKLFYKL